MDTLDDIHFAGDGNAAIVYMLAGGRDYVHVPFAEIDERARPMK